MHKLKVSDYARLVTDSEKTIYRKIKRGELKSEQIEGVLHVVCDELPSVMTSPLTDTQILKDARIELLEREGELLEKENEHLRQQVEQLTKTIQQMQTDASSSKERSDTIILQLTQQLDNQTRLLEDMREENKQQKKGFFKRLFRKG